MRGSQAVGCGVLGLVTLLLPLNLAGRDGESLTTGTVRGSVRYTGVVPPAKRIQVSDGSSIEHFELVVAAEGRGVRDVMVVLVDAPVQPKAQDLPPVVMDQVDWVFKPRLLGVRHGQAVRFDNSDSVNHSVRALSLVPENEFDFFVQPGRPVDHFFEPQKEPVILGCSLHAWMRAYIFVLRHPWFCVTDAQGRVEIPDVPAGTYTLEAIHPDTGLRKRVTIRVQPGQVTEVAIVWAGLDATKPGDRRNDP